MPSSIQLDAYCDESYGEGSGSGWKYFGILFVPHEKRKLLLTELNNRRCLTKKAWRWQIGECTKPCNYHDKNDEEMSYKKCSKSESRARISKSWVEDLLIKTNNLRRLDLVYFTIFGLDINKLDKGNFGPQESIDEAYYNRFFRTAFYQCKYFFSEFDNIVVNTIYHDKGNQEDYVGFPMHINRLLKKTDEKITIESERIIFINSDHRRYSKEEVELKEHSQFIQFIDVILGSIVCCLNGSSDNPRKNALAMSIEPLLRKMMANPFDKDSPYYRKHSIQFFPKDEPFPSTTQMDLFGKISGQGKQGKIYYSRPILLRSLEQNPLESFEQECKYLAERGK